MAVADTSRPAVLGQGVGLRSPWPVLCATSVGVLAVFLSTSGLVIALPAMSRDLGATAAQARWVLLSYMVTTTALILVFGRLGDIVGRRRLYLCGLALFTVATVGCALSTSPEVLIAARAVQGVGAAAVITNTTALLTDVFPAASLARGLGANAGVAATAQVAGPVVGGAATALWGWQGLFWLCLPLGLAALAASLLLLRASAPPPPEREPFDLAGALLSVLFLVAAVTALSPPPTGARGASVGLASAVAGAVAAAALVAFLIVQSRRAHPLVDLALLQSRAGATTYAAVLLQASSSFVLTVLASLYLQATAGVDALQAGLLISPAAAATVLAAVVAGSLAHRVSPRVLSVVGTGSIAVGLGCFAVAIDAVAPLSPAFFAALVLVGGGTGLFMTPSTSALMLAVPVERRGVANGLRSALQNLGYLLSTAVGLAIATAQLAPRVRSAAYDGTLSAVAGGGDLFVAGLRTAAVVLSAVALAGAAVCLAMPAAVTRHPD